MAGVAFGPSEGTEDVINGEMDIVEDKLFVSMRAAVNGTGSLSAGRDRYATQSGMSGWCVARTSRGGSPGLGTQCNPACRCWRVAHAGWRRGHDGFRSDPVYGVYRRVPKLPLRTSSVSNPPHSLPSPSRRLPLVASISGTSAKASPKPSSR